jgi:hypothetical protein
MVRGVPVSDAPRRRSHPDAVEEMFQPETCRQQRRFLTPAQFMQIVHRMPELFLGNIIIVDQGADIFQ